MNTLRRASYSLQSKLGIDFLKNREAYDFALEVVGRYEQNYQNQEQNVTIPQNSRLFRKIKDSFVENRELYQQNREEIIVKIVEVLAVTSLKPVQRRDYATLTGDAAKIIVSVASAGTLAAGILAAEVHSSIESRGQMMPDYFSNKMDIQSILREPIPAGSDISFSSASSLSSGRSGKNEGR